MTRCASAPGGQRIMLTKVGGQEAGQANNLAQRGRTVDKGEERLYCGLQESHGLIPQAFVTHELIHSFTNIPSVMFQGRAIIAGLRRLALGRLAS